jgi:hypothetical protein
MLLQVWVPRSWHEELTHTPQHGLSPTAPHAVVADEQVDCTVAATSQVPAPPGPRKAPVGWHTRFSDWLQSVEVSQGWPASATGQLPAVPLVVPPVVGLFTQKLLLPQLRPVQQSRLPFTPGRPQGPAPTDL